MTIREMHYDLKSKLNKLDSQQYTNLLVPEIDWRLNEAMGIYVKCIVEPRFKKTIAYEFNQRTIDDIRNIVVEQVHGVNCGVSFSLIPSVSTNYIKYTSALPTDYMYFVSGYVLCGRFSDSCKQQLRMYEKKKFELHEESPFDNSSFEWNEINVEVTNGNIVMYTDNTFVPEEACLNYIKKLPYIQNAQDWLPGGGTYYKADGVTLLVGFLNCPLPEQTHSEIVDLAVAIIRGDLQMPNYEVGINKLRLTEQSQVTN